jgi:hypothetical protein
MSSSTFNSISNALATGTIIAIVVGSVLGIAVLITIIIIIICIVKQSNRRKIMATQGMVFRQPQPQPYPYPHSWSNQYPPNTMSVSNYPPVIQPSAPPYIVPQPNYI